MSKPTVEKFIETVLSTNLVLDIGGGKPWDTGWIHKKYRTALEDKAYCVDFIKENKPHIVADVMNLPFKDNSVDGILCNAVLEHVDNPFKAIEELYRILSEDGELFLYVPWIWGYHSAPRDYFRYSPDGIKSLTTKFSEVQLLAADFCGLQPNRVYCALHLLLPNVNWIRSLLLRLLGIPLYMLYTIIVYAASFIVGNHNLRGLQREADRLLITNWSHGFYCLCRK